MTLITLKPHIAITPGVLGGKPHIAGHRIAVQDVVIWHEWLGQSADAIATNHKITLADVYAALAYYFDHQAEIDAVIREGEAFVTSLRRQIPSKVAHALARPLPCNTPPSRA